MPHRMKLITLDLSMFRFEKRKVEFKWPWGQTSTFPLNKIGQKTLADLLEADLLGLCYLVGIGKNEQAIAIDAVYPSGGMFNRGPVSRLARLLGDEKKIPIVGGWVPVEMFVEPARGARRKVSIKVVDHDGERLFKTGDTLFDSLSAGEEHCGGVLSIFRDGKLHDKTTYIEWYGTHGACPCFQGFQKPFEGHASPTYEISGVDPEDFKVGDELVLEFDLPLTLAFDFEKNLRFNAGMLSAFVHSFDKKKSLKMPELQKELAKRAGPAVDTAMNAGVVRFRQESSPK